MGTTMGALTNAELDALEVKYKDSPGIVKTIQGEKAIRAKIDLERSDALQATIALELAKEDFMARIAKLVKLPAPPDGISNVYLVYKEVDEPQGEPEAIKLPDGSTEMRQGHVKVTKWVVELNKAITITSGQHNAKTGTITDKPINKRTCEVYKKNESGQVVLVGTYPTGADAARVLGFGNDVDNADGTPKVGINAKRVLVSKGYRVFDVN